MNNSPKKILSVATIGTLAAIGIFGAAGPASAADPAKNSQGQCLATPSGWNLTNHAATFRDNTIVTPGTAADVRKDMRWSREVPGVAAVVNDYTQYQRVYPKVDAVEQWKFRNFVPGQKEIVQEQGQFSRTNPGQGEQTYLEYKYSKPSTILETKYKKADVKLKYTYIKYVKGVVQVKQGKNWVDTGTAFDYEVYPGMPPQTSFENKPVLETGGHNAVLSEWNEGGRQYRKVTTNYQYQNTNAPTEVPTGTFTYEYFATNPGSPWVSTGITREVPGPTILYKDGAWTTDTPGSPWVKVDQRSTNNPDYVAPFTEYRAQDGSATTDVNNAGWFPETSFDGWTSYGQRKPVVTQEYIADQTFYLTRDTQGNLGQSTNEADASWFTSNDGVDPKWVEFGRVTKTEGTPERTVFLTESDEGVIGETDDVEKASWVRADNTYVDLTIWQQRVDKFGDPILVEFTEKEAIPSYIEYYNPNGAPTRTLTDTNWTTDQPKGWNLVDKRDFEIKKATPPVTTVTSVLDKGAWTEKKAVPATYEACELAETGSDPAGLATLGGLLALGGAAAIVVARKRGRHLAEPETGMNEIL